MNIAALAFAGLIGLGVSAGAPALAAPPAAPPAYRVVERIAGPDGGWDYASFDPVQRRVYVAHGDSVIFVDLATGKVAPLAPASRPHEALPLPGGAMVLETDGGSSTARLIDTASGAVLAAIPTGRNPDAAAFDPATSLVFVMNGGSGDVTVIDPAARKAVATIPIGGKLEFAAADGAGRMFVNVEDKAEIAVIDTRARQISARYKLDGCEEPTGLAFVPETRVLIAACANGRAEVVDAGTGKVAVSLKIGAGADAVLYDPVRRLAFIPCGRDGVLEVISAPDARHAAVVAHVPTQRSARTGAVDPATGRIYLPAATYAPAATPGGRPPMQPGSFAVLVVAPELKSR